jgi:hypothetical protein
MPVLRVDDQAAGLARPRHLLVDTRQDRFGAADGKTARRIGEVVLDVDHQQGGLFVVLGHGPDLTDGRHGTIVAPPDLTDAT